MAKIKIHDLPRDMEIDQELMRRLWGGIGFTQPLQYPINLTKLRALSSLDQVIRGGGAGGGGGGGKG